MSVRFCAFVVDWLIRITILYAMLLFTAVMGGFGIALWLILLFGLEWLYPVAFELTSRAATPGKRALGLKVVMETGLPVTAAASVTRNLLRVADFLPFGFGIAIASMLTRRDCKRLGDIAAATLVVYERVAAPRVQLDEAAPLAPARPLSPADQAALVSLAVRAPTLTPERLDELAALAAAASGDAGHAGPQVTRRVLGVVQWILGRRP